MKKIDLYRISWVLKRMMKRAATKSGQKEIKMRFNEKLSSSKGIDAIMNKLKLMYQYFLDPEVPPYKKVLIGAILLYFIHPVDVVPDLFPLAGFLDDTVVVLYGWNLLNDELENYINSKKSGIVNHDGEVVYDVKYTVDEER